MDRHGKALTASSNKDSGVLTTILADNPKTKSSVLSV
jgi:hypothetical protein